MSNKSNKLARLVQKFKPYPNFILSTAIGSFIPFVGTAGIRFEAMSEGRVVATLKNKRKVRNHIGQLHAGAMILLAETASGLAVGMNVPDDRLPLMKSLKGDFVKRSQGDFRAEAVITPEQREMILSQEKGEVLVSVRLTDESGEEPVICEMLWAWVPKRR